MSSVALFDGRIDGVMSGTAYATVSGLRTRAQIDGLTKSRDFRSLLFGNSIAARLLRRIEPILPNPAAAGATAHGQRQQNEPGNCK